MGAAAVTFGLALSLLPILLRVLPPLARDTATHARDPNQAETVVGLLLYGPQLAYSSRCSTSQTVST